MGSGLVGVTGWLAGKRAPTRKVDFPRRRVHCIAACASIRLGAGTHPHEHGGRFQVDALVLKAHEEGPGLGGLQEN